MTWKCETHLNALPRHASLRIKCTCCGVVRFEAVRDLVVKARLGSATLRAVEKALYCADRNCTGDVTLSLAEEASFELPTRLRASA